MNPKYFKDKILTELNESEEYMKKSIDFLKSHPKWSYAFKVMSDERFTHAEQLYKMFMELYLDSKDHETYLNSLRDIIVQAFASKNSLIDGYRATYNLMGGCLEPEEMDDGDNTD